MDLCLILNPSAGTFAEAEGVLKRFVDETGCGMRLLQERDDARRFAREAVEGGCTRLVVGGGDGTVNDVLNGIAPDFDAVELAILPLGTGNDLVRCLHVPDEEIADAIGVCANGPVASLDLGVFRSEDFNDRYFLNAAIGGYGGEISAAVESESKGRWGPLAYWAKALTKLSELPEYDITLTIDDHRFMVRAYGLAVANGRFVAGGIPIAPKAILDDGLFDVVMVTVQPPMEAIAAGLELVLGRHESDSGHVIMFRGRHIAIESNPPLQFNVDGEVMGRRDATIEVLPRVMRIVVGPDAVGVSQRLATQGATQTGAM